MSALNSGVTGPNFTKFSHDIGLQALFYAVNANIEVAISHSVFECQSDKSGEFAIFHKSVAMATSLEISKKAVQIDRVHPKRSKDCENRSTES